MSKKIEFQKRCISKKEYRQRRNWSRICFICTEKYKKRRLFQDNNRRNI